MRTELNTKENVKQIELSDRIYSSQVKQKRANWKHTFRQGATEFGRDRITISLQLCSNEYNCI